MDYLRRALAPVAHKTNSHSGESRAPGDRIKQHDFVLTSALSEPAAAEPELQGG